VEIPDEVKTLFTEEELQALTEILSLDPRPRYHDDPQRIYGMPFAGRDVKFRVEGVRIIILGAPRIT
jgi:hypothetical protein